MIYPDFMYPKDCPVGTYYAGKGLPDWLRNIKPLWNFAFETVALCGYWIATIKSKLK